MKRALLFGGLVMAGLHSAQGWTRAYQLNQSWLASYWWGNNPKLWVNTSFPLNLRPLPPLAMDEWRLSGANRYPYYGGMTGRDCGDGDYWLDDDDGYNVIDYWDRCDNTPWTVCAGNVKAETIPIDTYGTSSELAEMDVVMCSDIAWSSNYDYEANKSNFQSIMTHELGHVMGLGDLSGKVDGVASTMTMGSGLEEWEETWRSALAQDDLNGIESIYGGACKAGDWVLETTSGQNVTRNEYMDQRCGVHLSVKINSNSSSPTWLEQVRVRNNRLGGYLKNTTYLEWEEYDKGHSAIVTVYVRGYDNVVRELNYARNASNHWHRQGWVGPLNPGGAAEFNNAYNTWVACRGNVFQDYISEYGQMALKIEGVSVQHFVYTGWPAGVDHGVHVRNVKVVRR